MMLIRVYRQLYVIVFALYVYFNRGIAYTYLAEMVWFLGLLLMARNWKAYLFPWDRKVAFAGFFSIGLFSLHDHRSHALSNPGSDKRWFHVQLHAICVHHPFVQG